ncbi:MAG: hypothetical protein HGA85_06735, partial [Nanoarchaeota archaeon]|nr:hypothetical protein [Nanoarchaeota archaeon]
MKQIIHAMKKKAGHLASIALLALFIMFGLWISLIIEPVAKGQTYNTTALVNTTLNITNSAPMVSSVLLPTPINLVAYSNTTVQCNASVFDYDNQTLGVNATFYIEGLVDTSSP